ncbi:MAG: WD40 repeat domain-containing protein [Thermogutta sp.]|nr:WD40 repeat domain-containing protein [Thermogutta sp.]
MTITRFQQRRHSFCPGLQAALAVALLVVLDGTPFAAAQTAAFSSFRTVDSRREGGVPAAVVTAIAAEPRAGLLLTAGDDRKIRVYEAWGDRLLFTVPGEEWVHALDADPTGRWFAAADGLGTVTLGSLAAATSAKRVKVANSALRAVKFSPDGRSLAVAGFEPTVWILDVATGRVAAELPVGSADLRAIAFSPDGKFLAATGRSGNVRLWTVADLRPAGDLPLSHRRLRALAFSPDGKLLAAGGDEGAVIFYDLVNRATVDRWELPSGAVTVLAFCGTDRLAVGTTENLIVVYDAASRSAVADLRGHTGTIACLSYLAEQDVLASGSFDTTAQFWRLDRGPFVSERRRVLPEPLR